MNLLKAKYVLVCLVYSLFPVVVLANIGVGVGSGKINVTQKLRPGMIYDLPSVPVINTGDEPSDYAVSIEYHQDQSQFQPPAEWFKISPEIFHLEPKESKLVQVSLSLPLKVKPGDYFAYLSAHPVKKDVPGQTSVSIAAASKLYFTISPANFLMGIYYRVISFANQNQPWTYVVLGVTSAALLIMIFRRFFSFSIGVRVRN